jgi:hypothetical protein
MLVEFVSVPFMLTCFSVDFLTTGFYTLASVVVERVAVTTLPASLLVPLGALLLYTATAIFDEIVLFSLGSASMSVDVLAFPLMFVALAVFRVEVPAVSLFGTCLLVGILASRRFCVLVAFAIFVVQVPAFPLLFTGMSIRALASLGLLGRLTVAFGVDAVAVASLLARIDLILVGTLVVRWILGMAFSTLAFVVWNLQLCARICVLERLTASLALLGTIGLLRLGALLIHPVVGPVSPCVLDTDTQVGWIR